MNDPGRAGVFTLAFDAKGVAPSLVAARAMLRTRLFAAPHGDQGLLISRGLHDEIGGFAPTPPFEDVDFISRLVRAKGGRAMRVMKANAVTSADRYERDGYFDRVVKSARRLTPYRLGVALARITGIYAR